MQFPITKELPLLFLPPSCHSCSPHDFLPLDCRALPARLNPGTMDALLRGGDEGWHRMLHHIFRTLKPSGGRLLQVWAFLEGG